MIVKTVILPLGPVQAFELFTKKINDWWPPDRRHIAGLASRVVLLENGRFYERALDGREVELGIVRCWEFPSRLLLDFFVGTGPEKPTEVEISFVAEGGRTRMTVVHRPKPESIDLWSERASRYDHSWHVVLAALSQAAA